MSSKFSSPPEEFVLSPKSSTSFIYDRVELLKIPWKQQNSLDNGFLGCRASSSDSSSHVSRCEVKLALFEEEKETQFFELGTSSCGLKSGVS